MIFLLFCFCSVTVFRVERSTYFTHTYGRNNIQKRAIDNDRKQYQLTRNKIKQKKTTKSEKQIGFSEYVNKNRILSMKRRIVLCLPSKRMMSLSTLLNCHPTTLSICSICFVVAESLICCISLSELSKIQLSQTYHVLLKP